MPKRKRQADRERRSPARQATAPPTKTRAAGNWLVYVLIVAATLFVFAQARDFALIDFDDLAYVNDNPRVTSGLSIDNIRWAFTNGYEGNWIPLTWISYMLDFELGGLDGGQYHVTNVVLHAATACLLFWVLHALTGARLPSAFVALLFAVHPLHVESVAWVAERKDVLSALFWCLTLAAYVHYVRRPTSISYMLVAAAFVASLLAKPMAVTLPFVLLLLDWWPLRRFMAEPHRLRSSSFGESAGALAKAEGSGLHVRRPIVEKIPLVAISVALGIVTLNVQGSAGAVVSLEGIPLIARIQNAVVSYALYVVKTVWPSGLAALYPYVPDRPVWQPAAAALFLAGLSWLAWRTRRSQPALLSGWLWYLITLAPVSGIIHTGPQARADRYTYLPMIGLGIMAAFALDHLARRLSAHRRTMIVAASAALVVYAVVARTQTAYWKDTETVFRRAIAVTDGNYIAHAALGTALRNQGRVDDAIASYRQALQISPANAEAHAGLGLALLSRDQPEEAAAAFNAAIRQKPNVAEFHENLGTALQRLGRVDDAETSYRESIRLAPHRAASHSGLGSVLAARGDADAALAEFREAVRLDPGFVDARYNLGLLLVKLNRTVEAIQALQETARIAPDSVPVHATLAGALTEAGRYDEAIATLNAAIRIEPANPRLHNNLAGVLLAVGRVDEAIAHLTEATRLDPESVEFRRNLDLARRAKGGSGL